MFKRKIPSNKPRRSNCLDWSCSQYFKTHFFIILNDLAYFGYKKKMFKRKYLATNQEKVTVCDAAGTVAVIVVDAVELQSMFQKLILSSFQMF